MGIKLNPSFLEKMKPGEIKQNIMVIYGDDTYLVERYTRLIDTLMVSEDVLEMREATFSPDDIVSFLTTVSFFGGFKKLKLIDPNINAMSDSSYETMIKLLCDMDENTGVIISLTSTKATSKKNDRVKRIIDIPGDRCGYLELKKPMDSSMPEFVFSYTVKAGGTIGKSTAKYIAENLPTDKNRVARELDKLISYAHGEEITAENIQGLMCKSVDASTFAMVDDLLGGRVDRALSTLDTLLENRADIFMILGGMSATFMDGYAFSIARRCGMGTGDVKSALGIDSEFRLNKGARLASRFSEDFFGDCILMLLDFNRGINSGGADEEIKLEMLISSIYHRMKEETVR